MIIEIWLEFLGSLSSFEPFVYIVITILVVCLILLIRSLKVW